jgi:LPS export ABC transporter protein LptC
LTSRLSSRKIKYILFFCILLLAASLAAVFIRHRLDRGFPDRQHPPEATEAVLSIQGFRHSASQDGRKQWTLEADSAHLHVDPSEARLVNVKARFFPENGETVDLTADRGLLELTSNNISATGNVVIVTPEYTIQTENLHYDHQSHMIQSGTRVTVTGPSFRLTAGKMDYNIRTGEIKCWNHVEGVFSDVGKTGPE